MAAPTRDVLYYDESQRTPLTPYLPSQILSSSSSKPHVTLTFATSLDSSIALAPGTQTHLSGPSSKAMTHFLRSCHSAILIGVGTALADNPSLNCRLSGVGGYGGSGLDNQPRPIILDPSARWGDLEGRKVIQLAREGKGKAPIIFFRRDVWEERMGDEEFRERMKVLEECGGGYYLVAPAKGEKFAWVDILGGLKEVGIRSVMIEGGGAVINELLGPENFPLVDSVIITIAPTWLGRGGVLVSPEERRTNGVQVPVGRLTDVKWVPLGEDVVCCGRPNLNG
ncbi:5-amino-6-uracil reductase-like protein [Delitschia confertaspora ATCC 74209]|uniref:2,5-diamino-6-ribosylamino-4(3H)-pyrimidinone 5'-phosphate reductase n=1 Tax=Delitschia confertaspora ATCC 74209 TaxID=1513339 RepID=A0A9P4JUI9_9PLEO|nr:5-amino-6-uracil reductase-like protein [Delitschia confertaspora ATCC 74209]